MSKRAEAIKAHLQARKKARQEAGGEWRRRGECKMCGACCDSRNINLESYMKKAAEVKEKTGKVLSSICANYGVLPDQDGKMGCQIHNRVHGLRLRGDYPSGCASFPDNEVWWRLVMDTCGYWFEWVADEDKAVGKARRAKADAV